MTTKVNLLFRCLKDVPEERPKFSELSETLTSKREGYGFNLTKEDKKEEKKSSDLVVESTSQVSLRSIKVLIKI